MDAAIAISDLTVVLDQKVTALDKVSLELHSGRTIGLIGPSGAGKTTLIKCIVGRLAIPSGKVSVLGLPAGSAKLREQVTYMAQDLSVYPDLTVNENMIYFSKMAGIPRKDLQGSIDTILKTVDLSARKGHVVETLSGGEKQRVSLAIALIGAPKLMVLDEPTVGLDPVLRNKLWSIFTELAESGVTLIISSHSMDEARRCDDLVLIREGHIIAHSTPGELLASTMTKTIEDAFLKLVGVRV